MATETDFDEIKPEFELIEENTDKEDNLQQSVPVNSCRLSLCIICNESVSTCKYEYLNAHKVRLILMAAVVSKNIGLSTAEATISEGRSFMCNEHLDSVYEMMCSATGATNEESVSTSPVETITECFRVYKILAASNFKKKLVYKHRQKNFEKSLRVYFRSYQEEMKRRDIVCREELKKAQRTNWIIERIMTESDKSSLNTTLHNFLMENNIELDLDDMRDLLNTLGAPEYVPRPKRPRKLGWWSSGMASASRAATSTPETVICKTERAEVEQRFIDLLSRMPNMEPKTSQPDPSVLKWKESVLSRLKEKQSQIEIKVECLEVPPTEKVILNPEESVLARLKRKRMEMEMTLKEPKKEPKEEPEW